ncbi:AAA family ATPase [Methanofollis fontis]|uniref:Rad50/SbcC-type AAA domain-containing protein n=1 Tax=Methanofollis fontis TaxID=2052832 RepID=A0A483CU35_9EURY|nr:SMC family ATPase [Methanofollis fontis]TAJ44264.1 hypothetical protein CUJ86_09630 [Methanofollis fontis]
MLLNRLVLQNFKRYRQTEIRFADGITGIVGNNGAGKSTIIEAVFFALFGLQGGPNSAYIVSSFAGPKERCEVRLDFAVGGTEYTVRRTYRRTVSSTQHDAELFMDGRQLADGVSAVGTEVRRLLGMSPADFRHTVFAAQKDLLSLLDTQPGRRKEWFMRVLGIDRIRDESLAILKEESDRLEGDLDQIGGRLAEIDEEATGRALEGATETIRTLTAATCEREEECTRLTDQQAGRADEIAAHEGREREYLRLGEQAKAAQKEISDLQDECQRLAAEIDGCAALVAECEDLERRIPDYRQTITDYSDYEERHRKNERCRDHMEVLDTEASGLRTRITRIDTALQDIDRDTARCTALLPSVERRDEVTVALAEARKKEQRFRDAQARTATAEAHFSEIERAIASLEAEITHLREKFEECTALEAECADVESVSAEAERLERARTHVQEIERLRSAIAEEERECGRLRSGIDSLRTAIKKCGDPEEEIQTAESAVRRVSEEIIRAESERTGLQKKRQELLEWREEIRRLGPDSPCPTCTRPLHDHHATLLEDSETEAAALASSIKDLDTAIIGWKTEEAELRKRTAEIKDSAREVAEMERRIAAMEAEATTRGTHIQSCRTTILSAEEALANLGCREYDPAHHRAVQERRDALREVKIRYERLTGECAALPQKETERERLYTAAEGAIWEIDRTRREQETIRYDPGEIARFEDELNALDVDVKEFLAAEARCAQRPGLEAERNTLSGQLLKTEKHLQALSAEIEALGYDRERFEALRSAAEASRSRIERYQELRIATGHLPSLRQRQAHAGAELSAAAERFCECEKRQAALGFDPLILSALREEAKDADRRITALREEIAGRRRDISHWQEKKTGYEEKIERAAALHSKKTEIGAERERLKLTRTLISEYAAYLLGVVRGHLEGVVGDVLSEITDGRYDSVLIDDDFTPLINDMGADYPADRFSGGEQDDIAIALRIALSRYLSEVRGARDPTVLIFDEIFGSQDEERRANLIRALRTQEAHFPQILLISHIGEVQEEFETTLRVEAGPGQQSRVECVE